MSDRRIHVFVTGKVQGVFFRQSLKVMAKKNGVFGWVRNLSDGRVEAVLEADQQRMDGMIRWINRGPANSRVENVEVAEEKFVGEFSRFDVLY